MAFMQGWCWPLSAAPGESIEFRIATTSPRYQLTFVRFQNQENVTAEVIRNSHELEEIPVSITLELLGQTQPAPNPNDLNCADWEFSFSLDIPEDWDSNIYAARCVEINDPDGEHKVGETFYIVFVVNPSSESRNRLLVLANVTAWNAYNTYGGRSRYTPVGGGDFEFSYLRPNPHTVNLTIPDSSDSPLIQLRYPVGETTRHLTRGELWLLGWLQQSGYECDVYTDLDWHIGINSVEEYSAVILTTHPEYWSIPMLKNLKAYLDQGGRLLYLGANGIFDAVDISDDWTVMTVHGTVDDNGRTMRFRDIGMPESSVLGIAYVANVDSRKGYQIKDDAHRFLQGIVTNGEIIGTEGWNIPVGGTSLDQGGASGWEVDRTDASSPPVQVLAEGVNASLLERAQMVYYDHPGGGFVFSVGSITFGGSLMQDDKLQQIMRRVLDECLK
jgi:hypothetical protein